MTTARRERFRTILRWLIAAAFLAAGIVHIVSPGGFLKVTPGWVPWPAQVIFWTGVCEIVGAVALFVPPLRQAAGAALALYSVCVFPANINHAINMIEVGGTTLGWGYHAPRLLFQPVIVWWALFAGSVIDWPFGTVRPRNRSG